MELIEAEVVQERPRPWGFWATMGLSLAIGGGWVATSLVVVLVAALLSALDHPQIDPAQTLERLGASGLVMALSTWLAGAVAVGLVVLFVKIRRPWSLKDYLALAPVSAPRVAGWLLAVLGLTVCSDTLTYLLGREVVPQSHLELYRTAGWPPLLWSALILAAPLLEETFFRGFMFRGLEASALGSAGAILVTALLWSLAHVGYDAYQIATIFLGGILFGLARQRTQSLYTTLAMHAMWNLVATVEVAWAAAG